MGRCVRVVRVVTVVRVVRMCWVVERMHVHVYIMRNDGCLYEDYIGDTVRGVDMSVRMVRMVRMVRVCEGV